jgi:hypothetical protein
MTTDARFGMAAMTTDARIDTTAMTTDSPEMLDHER